MATGVAQNADSGGVFTAGGTFAERHYSPKELGALWNLSTDTMRRLFQHEEGVLLIPSPNSHRMVRANYRTMLIPESVAKRVHASYSVGKRKPNRYG